MYLTLPGQAEAEPQPDTQARDWGSWAWPIASPLALPHCLGEGTVSCLRIMWRRKGDRLEQMPAGSGHHLFLAKGPGYREILLKPRH